MTNRVLITGATGLIGRGVYSELGTEHEVILTARKISNLSPNDFHPYDLSKVDGIVNFLDRLKPQVIVHTAAVTSIDEVAQNLDYANLLNIEATREIAKWCEENNVRMIHFSSDFVFNGLKTNYQELDLANPISSYGKTKLLSEQAVQSILRNHLIIRPILVYGYFDGLARMNFPLLVLSNLRSGKKMEITEDQLRMPTHVSDVSEIVNKTLFSEETGLLHIAGSELLSVYDFALKIADHFQLDKSLMLPVKTHSANRDESRPLISGFDLQRAKSLFGYHPKTIEEGLRFLAI